MPPKKKRGPVNLVVGTVSTRSTRRQSIVNIEIPKSNKSIAKTGKGTKTSNETTTPIDEEGIKEFARKIKSSYSKFIGSDNVGLDSNINASQEALDKDNRAILQILQDWDEDDEDPTERTHEAGSSSSRKNETILMSKCIPNENKNESSMVSEYSDNKEMELMLSEGLENDEETCSNDSKNEFKISDESLSKDATFEEVKDDSSISLSEIVQTETIEVIIEDDDDDMIVNEHQSKKIEINEHANNTVPDTNKHIEKEIAGENSELPTSMQTKLNISGNNQSNSELEQIPVAKNEIDSQISSSEMESMPVTQEHKVELQESNETSDMHKESIIHDQLNNEDCKETSDISNIYTSDNLIDTDQLNSEVKEIKAETTASNTSDNTTNSGQLSSQVVHKNDTSIMNASDNASNIGNTKVVEEMKSGTTALSTSDDTVNSGQLDSHVVHENDDISSMDVSDNVVDIGNTKVVEEMKAETSGLNTSDNTIDTGQLDSQVVHKNDDTNIMDISDDAVDISNTKVVEEMKSENTALNTSDNTINSGQLDSQVFHENDNASIMNAFDKTVDDTSLKDKGIEKMECDVGTSSESEGSPGNEEARVEPKTVDNSEETSSDFSSMSHEKKEETYENLENKIAELNLTDENQSGTKNEGGKIAPIMESKLDSGTQKKQKVPLAPKKPTTDKQGPKNASKEVAKKSKSNKTQESLLKSQRSDKEQLTKPVKNKPVKVPTFKIKKDKKPKEQKMKKITERPKKLISKDSDRSEKKDKKLGKFEEALKNIGKTESECEEIRRSSRIKSISVLNKKTTGWGLVKSKSETMISEGDVSDSNSLQTESDKSTPTASPKVSAKDRKSKPGESPVQNPPKSENQIVVPFKNNMGNSRSNKDPVVEARLKQFVHLKENLYKTDRMVCKEAKKMACDCFLTSEELEANEYGCGEDCLNRLLLIECGNICAVGDRCTNKRFQKSSFAPVEVFNTEKKGLGLRAAANIPFGEFILEYVGEVLNTDEFDKRAEVYSQVKNIHYYFMALRADAVIDATMKGNISRFINHSCDPNAETQKWTVNGELRIGFFSTRTILAGEEVTFDYRFQRYGKEAQKCFCGASICRGWLGEQPDSDEDEEEDEEDEDIKPGTPLPSIKAEVKDEAKMDISPDNRDDSEKARDLLLATPKPTPVKKKVVRKKPRFEMFEEVDQLNEEIEMLLATGLKNQAHTLKLSRMMVRAKEPQQRAKLLRVLRRGELPCRRLFLDYHGLRLMHGYMIDAQQLVATNKKFQSLRLEILQTLAVLPINNKTMLQDSKVLSTVEKWSTNKDLTSPADSESNSPKDTEVTQKTTEIKHEITEPVKDDSISERSIEDQEEEIRFLATKLLEEWKNLKEIFRIPKKERIERMKEHEREANKKFMQTNQNVYGTEEDKKMDRYRGISKGKVERDFQNFNRKPSRLEDKPSAEFLRLSRTERRKLFALQHELKEEERKLKQREMWRQHEMNCMVIGVDPRFTAPFDPGRGYQYIWNQQVGQWQTCPTESNPRLYPSQQPNQIPNLNLPPPHLSKPPPPGYQYASPMGMIMNQAIPSMQLPPLPHSQMPLPQNQVQGQIPPLPHNQIQFPHQVPGEIPLPATQVYHGHTQVSATPPLPQMPPPQEGDDPSKVKFLGPIPPPVKLPPKWKCAKDKYGRPYYYHIRIRKSQWVPPPLVEQQADLSESESSSESSTVSSDSSSENSDTDDDVDDTKLLLEVRRQMESLPRVPEKNVLVNPATLDDIPAITPSPDEKNSDADMSMEELKQKSLPIEGDHRRPSIDMRLKQLDLFQDDRPLKKKRRLGLCEEIIISPRTEDDKKQFKEDVKRYKANKEKLKRQREKILLQTKKQLKEIEMKKAKEKRTKTTVKVKLKEKPDFNTEAAKKIKEMFRTNMASTVVSALNTYRKPDCTKGRITNTQDFKHLARKLTHFVMLKEMKHITKIEDLTCTDNVKVKAREFIRKYMGKFGEVYIKRSDSPDFKD